MKASEGTDHQDSGKETSPQALEADLSVDSADLLTSGAFLLALGVQLGDDCVSRVRHDSAEDTSKISRGEGDAKLSCFVVVFLALREDVVIEELHEPFESNELDDRVGHLSTPQRTDTLVKAANAYIETFLPS